MAELEKRRWLITNCNFCDSEIVRRPDKKRSKRYCNLTCRNAERRGIVLTDEFRKEVFRLKEKENWTRKEIADFFGCNYHLIYRIIRGEL